MKISDVLIKLKKRISWNDLNDKPSSFPPATHSHKSTEVTVTGGKTLQQAIDDGDIGGSSGTAKWPIILDADSHKSGTGKLLASNKANCGRTISASGSTTTVITYMKTDDFNLGKFGITLRAKASNNSLSKTVLKIEIIKINGSSETIIKTINFKGTNFESTSEFTWLTSYFECSGEKNVNDKLGVRVSIGDSLGSSILFDLDYITIFPLMSAQYVMA